MLIWNSKKERWPWAFAAYEYNTLYARMDVRCISLILATLLLYCDECDRIMQVCRSYICYVICIEMDLV